MANNSQPEKEKKTKKKSGGKMEGVTGEIRLESCCSLSDKNLAAKTSDNNFISVDPLSRALVKRSQQGLQETQETAQQIFICNDEETGEPQYINVLAGYITPYEKEILENIVKFKNDNQVDRFGQIYFSVGQLYSAMRHGEATERPNAEQFEELKNALISFGRMIVFEMNDSLRCWKRLENVPNGEHIVCQLMHLYGIKDKIQGHKTWVFRVAEQHSLDFFDILLQNQYKCGQIVPQEVKAIQKNGKRWQLTISRIEIRQILEDFVFSYRRARALGAELSNKLTYKSVYELCNITSRAQQQRTREAIKVILNDWKNKGYIKNWKEYKNKCSRTADGVQISVYKALTKGAE